MDKLAVGILKAAAVLSLLVSVAGLIVMGQDWQSALVALAVTSGGFVMFAFLWAFATLVSDVRRWVGDPN